MLGTTGVFLCGAPFQSTPFLCAPHSPFLHKQKFLQIGVRSAKASFCLRELFGSRQFLAELTAAKLYDFRGNPNGFPLVARRNRATEGRRRAKLAAKPSYTCCSSSPKISHRFARCDFRGPRLFQRTHIIKYRRFTPSVSRSIGKLGRFSKIAILERAFR